MVATSSAGPQESAEPDVIVRRNGAGTIECRIIIIDDAGVTIRTGTGGSDLISWDRIREVRSDRMEDQVKSMRPIAEMIWRARSRLERGDTWLAEPLFDELFARYRGQSNDMALLVAEGLLRCRLARQAHASAIIPVLEMTRLRRRGMTHEAYAMLPSIWHEELELCTALPPFWVEREGVEHMQRALEEYDAGEDEVTTALATLYGTAMSMSRGENPPLPRTIALPRHPGIEFLRDLLAARLGDPERRTAAQVRLLRAVDDWPEWTEAWARYTIGTTLIEEQEPELIDRGLVQLAHVAARFGSTQPYLAGAALWHMAVALEARDVDVARSLQLELEQRFPHHPVLDARAPGGATVQFSPNRQWNRP